MEPSEKVLAWHFIANDHKLRFGDGREVITGETLTVSSDRRLYDHGLYASKDILDALKYASGTTLCRVEISGDIASESNKIVGSSRTCLWMINIDKILSEFACRCVERAFKCIKGDQRSIDAISTARAYIRGEISKEKVMSAVMTAEAVTHENIPEYNNVIFAVAYAAYCATCSAADIGVAEGTYPQRMAAIYSANAIGSVYGSIAKSTEQEWQRAELIKMIEDEINGQINDQVISTNLHKQKLKSNNLIEDILTSTEKLSNSSISFDSTNLQRDRNPYLGLNNE